MVRSTDIPSYLVMFGNLLPSSYTPIPPISHEPTHLSIYTTIASHHISCIHAAIRSAPKQYQSAIVSTIVPLP